MKRLKRIPSLFLCWNLILIAVPGAPAFADDQPGSQTPVVSAKPTPEQLQQLVAPIALYPDSLVVQILAAATYPDQVVEADRWLQESPGLKGDQLAQAVDQQPWDPSVKALTAFPSVLANMDKNLSWTSSLGDAYINNQQDVMRAVQVMRKRAKKAGNLKTTSQLNVTQSGDVIIIEPADPAIVYLPQYDPWIVYGGPVVAWPGWYWYPGLYWNSPGIALGVGFGVGFFSGFGWGWHHWEPDWHHNTVIYNHNTYISHSRTFVNRSYYANRGRVSPGMGGQGGYTGSHAFRGGGPVTAPQHGFEGPRGGEGSHGGAFGGFDHGGVTRSYSERGFSSAGGFHGGGGSHGGGRR